jgi:hypothetical protein
MTEPENFRVWQVWRRPRGETREIQSQQLGNQVTQFLGKIARRNLSQVVMVGHDARLL